MPLTVPQWLRTAFSWITLDRVLALVAIVFGVLGIIYAKRQDREAHEQRAKIENIVLSISTRYVGTFPDNLPHIRDLISRADKGDHVLIMMDFVGYGHYSSPKIYREYLREIKNAKRERNVG